MRLRAQFLQPHSPESTHRHRETARCTLVQLIAGVPYQDGNRSRTIPAEPHRTGYSFTVEATLRTKAAIEQARLAPPSVRRSH
jgi:hypothetical protein